MRAMRQVQVWLLIGLCMVFIQILVGGITRLTESGLSITKWEVVAGTFPPLTERAWIAEFDKYKATPQYKEINEGMNLGQFKFIYFWEYIHRLWARFMGFVFLIPFLYFLKRKWFDSRLLKDLGIVITLASLAAIFGWVMVASGLIERPWVNAYKLSIHLIIACSVFGYLFWTYLKVRFNYPQASGYKKSTLYWIVTFVSFFVVQLFLGGMMSGMKIAVVYPTWPLINGSFLPEILMKPNLWQWSNLAEYDKNEFAPAFTHFFHRFTAYILCIIYFILFYKLRKSYAESLKSILLQRALYLLGGSLVVQILLGIITVTHSLGKVPVFLGVAHQAGAVIILSATIYLIFLLNKNVD